MVELDFVNGILNQIADDGIEFINGAGNVLKVVIDRNFQINAFCSAISWNVLSMALIAGERSRRISLVRLAFCTMVLI